MIRETNLTESIIDIAKDLTRPTDYAMLLQNILNDSLDITNSDAGTLYILNQDKLEFMIMITRSKDILRGGDGNPVPLPPVELDSKSVCAYVARNKKTMNIADVYNDDQFDWDGPKKYDLLNEYHTKSELVIPLINHEQKVMGVLQLINSLNSDNELVSYSELEVTVMEAVASLAAVSLSNRNMINELQDLLESVVQAFTTAIDARTPFNANHTRHVAEYCWDFSQFLHRYHEEGHTEYDISDNGMEQLYMAANLHDVGKLIVPLEILNKSDRLDYRLPSMRLRWKWLLSDIKIKFLSGLISEESYNKELETYRSYIDFVEETNNIPFVDQERLEKILEMNSVNYTTSEGDVIDFITDEETHQLSIIKGTLTVEERRRIEEHAAFTTQILNKISFGDAYNHVRFYAGAHHEYLNGSGYPNGIEAAQIPTEVRILTIMDVFDSLTSSDRPYRKQSDKGKAISILYAMADEGKLDRELVKLVELYFEDHEVIA